MLEWLKETQEHVSGAPYSYVLRDWEEEQDDYQAPGFGLSLEEFVQEFYPGVWKMYAGTDA